MVFSKTITIPSEIAPEKYFAGLDFSYAATSSTGLKVNYKISLHPNGGLDYKSLYFGEQNHFCHNEGGRILKKIDPSQRKKLLLLAINANNHHQKIQKKMNLPFNERPLMLAVEFKDDYSLVNLDDTQKVTKDLKNGLFEVIEKIYQERIHFSEGLSLKVTPHKKSISFELKNIGKSEAELLLKSKNQDQFFFRFFDSTKVIFLDYKKPLKKIAIELKPSKSLKLSFKRPFQNGKPIDLSQGRFYFDNTSKVLDKNLTDASQKPLVHLCDG